MRQETQQRTTKPFREDAPALCTLTHLIRGRPSGKSHGTVVSGRFDSCRSGKTPPHTNLSSPNTRNYCYPMSQNITPTSDPSPLPTQAFSSTSGHTQTTLTISPTQHRITSENTTDILNTESHNSKAINTLTNGENLQDGNTSEFINNTPDLSPTISVSTPYTHSSKSKEKDHTPASAGISSELSDEFFQDHNDTTMLDNKVLEQQLLLEKRALQGLAKCVKGFTMQEVKRTYEPGPDNERRLKSEIVTRKTVAPNLDAILFTLANLAPERWQIKTTVTKRATNSSIKSNCTAGIENNTIDNNPFHQNNPNQNEERPIDLSTLSDAALEELSRLPEWPNTERRDENEHQEDNKPIVSTTLSSPCKGNAETTTLSKDHNLSKPVFEESTDNRLATESPTDPRENKLSCHRVSSNSYPQEELTNNVTDPNYNDHTAQNCNINPIYGPFKPSTYRHKNSFEKKHFISSFSHRDLTFSSPSKNCTVNTSQQNIGKPHKPNLPPHHLLFHHNSTAIKSRSQTHHEFEKSHTKNQQHPANPKLSLTHLHQHISSKDNCKPHNSIPTAFAAYNSPKTTNHNHPVIHTPRTSPTKFYLIRSILPSRILPDAFSSHLLSSIGSLRKRCYQTFDRFRTSTTRQVSRIIHFATRFCTGNSPQHSYCHRLLQFSTRNPF